MQLFRILIYFIIIIISAVIALPILFIKVGWMISEVIMNDMFAPNDNEAEE
jgi:uncharacterized membrane protein YhdT